MSTNSTWPKIRPRLTADQVAVMEDWYNVFLRDLLPGSYGRIDRFNHLYAIKSAVPKARTLEIGPGNGSHLDFENIDDQLEYIALELRDTLSRQISNRFNNLRVVVGDCQDRLDFPDSYFDRVLAIHVLEHLDNLPAALSEIVRVLKPSGKFSVVIPCEGGIAYKIGRRMTVQRRFQKRYSMPYDWMISYDHVNQAREVLDLLRSNFRVLDQTYFPLQVRSIDLNIVIGLTLSLK